MSHPKLHESQLWRLQACVIANLVIEGCLDLRKPPRDEGTSGDPSGYHTFPELLAVVHILHFSAVAHDSHVSVSVLR